MFTCKYCGTEFLEHTPNCPNCGAPIKISESNGKKGEPKSIREVCIKYEEVRNLYLDETIDEKRMATVRGQFNIAASENVIMVYDDTIFGNNKVGFAICAGGLYWKNDWSVDTKRTFLAWEAFEERELSLDGYHIQLGHGDVIGMAGDQCDGLEGPFAALKSLKYGDQIIVHMGGAKYIYEVRNTRLAYPYSTSFAFESKQDAAYLTLITCSGYNPLNESYLFRRVVRAVLIEVK